MDYKRGRILLQCVLGATNETWHILMAVTWCSLVRWSQTLWMHLFPHFQGYINPLDAGGRHILQQTLSALWCYTMSCKYSHSPSYNQNFLKEISFQATIGMSLKFHFKLHFHISLKKLCSYYFAKEGLFISISLTWWRVYSTCHLISHFPPTTNLTYNQVFNTYPVRKSGSTCS